MYETFFGLHGEPFSVAPDPRFMYLSDPHREALSHLEIGLRGAGGFVLLTGEIGAGKTTVWRSFLEQLPSHFDVATVVNPRLGVDALLARLCADLGVELTEGPGRDAIDALHGHLLLAHAQGRRTLIAVDEAQALSEEVLEQLRLLTNLVTSDRKLLQVLLIGQPELLDLLERPALEPLAQRVVARYHLPALTEAETRRYIAHRLAVAGTGGVLPFDDDALARIHAHCGGVPRRINVLCDRALLAAWQARVSRVDGALADRVAREVFARPERPDRQERPDRTALAPAQQDLPPPPEPAATPVAAPEAAAAPVGPGAPAAPAPPSDPRAVWIMAAMALVAGLVLSPWLRTWLAGPAPAAATLGAAPAPPAADVAVSPPLPLDAVPGGPPAELATTVLAATDDLYDLADDASAWRDLGTQFGVRLGADDPCVDAALQGLSCFRSQGGVAQLRQLDRPALIGLVDERGRSVRVTLVGLSVATATLQLAGQPRRLPLTRLARDWRGELVTLWRPPPGYREGQVAVDDGSPLARWVAERLLPLDASPGRPIGERLRAFQRAQGLVQDGIAGPLTLMALSRAGEVGVPRLLSP